MTPKDYGLPHDKWRSHQQETIDWIYDQNEQFVVVEAPTGSGKTGVGTGLGRYGTVRSLTKTNELQRQYGRYNFEPLYGMRNYQCALMPFFQADGCSHPDNMFECPSAGVCEYLMRRKIVSEAQRQALGYQYYFTATWPRNNPVDFLYCDEAHDLSEIVMQFSTLEWTLDDCDEHGIGHFPKQVVPAESVYKIILKDWVSDSLARMIAERSKMLKIAKNGNIGANRRATKLKYATGIFEAVLNGLDQIPDAYAATCDGERLRIVPLTAKFDTLRLLGAGETKVVLTSATIGDAETFCDAIGIKEHAFRSVPSRFTPEQMPVFVPKDAPKISSSITESGLNKQADIIAGMISDSPPEWAAMIHFASRRSTNDMAHRLSRRGLGDRIYVVDGEGTVGKANKWRNQMDKRRNTVALTYSFHEGLDAPDVQMNIVAKIPFATLDNIGKRVMEYNKKYYTWRAALRTQQACGRTRRGNLERDYEEENAPMKKFVAIVDGNINMVKGHFSDYFRDCLVKI